MAQWQTSNNVYGNFYNDIQEYNYNIQEIDDDIYTHNLNNNIQESYAVNTNNLNNNITPITLEKLNKISKLSINKKKEYRCIICYDYIKKNSIVRTLKCTHKYHTKCIDRWFYKNNNCPLCMTIF